MERMRMKMRMRMRMRMRSIERVKAIVILMSR
jgi:hypothetical protein